MFLSKKKGNRIYMWWYKMPNGQNNFGDVLGPYIVHKISGFQIKYVAFPIYPFKAILLFTLRLIKRTFKLKDFKLLIFSLFKKNILLSTGSILSSHDRKSTMIWGAGLLNSSAKIKKAQYFAVRGKYSLQKVRNLGYKEKIAIGDPALLLPLIIPPSKKEYELGIIPHYIHYDEVKKEIHSNNVIVIDLLNDIETVTKQITKCKKTISSSLHGLIVSHSYKIPSLWVNFSQKKLAGDNIKFKDYFSSVGITEYNPIEVNLEEFIVDKIVDKIINLDKLSNIQNDLNFIQKELINSAPFFIKKEFKI